MTAPTRATVAGRAYLDLRNKARADRRPVDELLHLYVLEAFLARLAASRLAAMFVLKGGLLLAAHGQRRPTRDIDLRATEIENDVEHVRTAEFAFEHATAETIRDEEPYSGVRVTIDARLSTARIRFHVDVNVGDPVVPLPEMVHIPGLLGGDIALRGYPLPMVHAEKIVTAIARGTVNTRWRDFADVYPSSRHHAVAGTTCCVPCGRCLTTEVSNSFPSLALWLATDPSAGGDGRCGDGDNASKAVCQNSSTRF